MNLPTHDLEKVRLILRAVVGQKSYYEYLFIKLN